MKRLQLSPLCLLAGSLLFPGSASANQALLRVCNDGKIPVYAAVVSEHGLLWPLKFHGWEKISPGNRNLFNSCLPFFIGGANANSYYIVFGLYNRDQRFGAVRYSFGNSNGSTSTNVCVPAPGKSESTCSKVPVSAELQPRGSRNIDVTLTVKPDIGDPVAVYLEPGSSEAASTGTQDERPEPESKGLFATMADAYNKSESNKARLTASCKRWLYGDTFGGTMSRTYLERTTGKSAAAFCVCDSAAIANSLNSDLAAPLLSDSSNAEVRKKLGADPNYQRLLKSCLEKP